MCLRTVSPGMLSLLETADREGLRSPSPPPAESNEAELRCAFGAVIAACLQAYIKFYSSSSAAAAGDDSLSGQGASVWDFEPNMVPSLDIPAFCERLLRHTKTNKETALLALLYIDRLIQNGKLPELNGLTVYRIFATAFVLASKFYDDQPHTNAHYAKVVGVSLAEFNVLERTMLSLLEFQLAVHVEEFEQYCVCVTDLATTALQLRNGRCWLASSFRRARFVLH